MSSPETQFLHQRNPNFHFSPEVEQVVHYLNSNAPRGENGELKTIPNEPSDKISAYLGFLADHDYVNDGILTGDQASIDGQIERYVVKSGDVSEGYFELQRRIAREQGHGDIEITPDLRKQLIEAVQADQRSGLGKWVEYLGGEDGGYPDWFKYYTFGSVVKLGNYDKDKGEFLKRSKGTTAPYPELNREALAYVYDALNRSRIKGERVDGDEQDEELQRLLQGANFGKLYAHAVLAIAPTSPELREEVRGSWLKYNQTSDPRTARRLSGSLQGHGTGWCTAGESTANIQLTNGDFYVYYTRDEDGKDTVPRVAIRMQQGTVAEVRGVNAAQELEPAMADITAEQLKDLVGGEIYIQKAEDMKWLTAIDKKLMENPSAELSRSEVRFLYEFDHSIQGFGYETDPRIAEIRAKRGDRDRGELRALLLENIGEQIQTSHAAYATIAEQLNGMRRRRARVEITSQSEFATALRSKLEAWRHDNSLEWCVDQIMNNGGRISLVATPNVIAGTEEIIGLAQEFGKQQPYGTYVNDEFYRQYSGEQLSGSLIRGSSIKFSLIPGGLDESLVGNIEQQRDILRRQRATTSSLKVPSVLESLTYWQTLRARGDKLDDDTAFNKTIIRHFDLAPKSFVRWSRSRVPYSFGTGDGEPGLAGSAAQVGSSARLAVG